MEHIKTNSLKHNPEVIKSYFRIKDDITIVTEDIKIVFPDRWLNKELAFIEDTVKVIGLFGIIDSKGNYASSITPIYYDIDPNMISEAICDDGVVYKVLHLEAGSVFLSNNNLVVTDSGVYYIFDEIFIKANIPWYVSYDQLPDILAESRKYCDSNIGDNRILFEVLASMVARGEDKTEYYRHVHKDKPNWIALNNIYYSYKNTGAKLIGGYYGYGVSSAIVNPEVEATKIEKHLMEGGS